MRIDVREAARTVPREWNFLTVGALLLTGAGGVVAVLSPGLLNDTNYQTFMIVSMAGVGTAMTFWIRYAVFGIGRGDMIYLDEGVLDALRELAHDNAHVKFHSSPAKRIRQGWLRVAQVHLQPTATGEFKGGVLDILAPAAEDNLRIRREHGEYFVMVMPDRTRLDLGRHEDFSGLISVVERFKLA